MHGLKQNTIKQAIKQAGQQLLLASSSSQKPAMQFYAMYNDLLIEVRVVLKFVSKLNGNLRSKLQRLEKHPDEILKLFSSPKKPSRDYQKALVELKSYCRYLTNDSNINTGRELNDIRRAVENYLGP